LTEATRPLLDVAHIIKVDALEPLDPAAVDLYRSRGLRLLAEKVEDMESFERFKSMGFSLFQGYFYARASPRSGRRSSRQQPCGPGSSAGGTAARRTENPRHRAGHRARRITHLSAPALRQLGHVPL